jgi:hypothetical protein
MKWVCFLIFSACLKAEAPVGTFKCSVDSPDASESEYTCPAGYTCDDRVCCSWAKNVPCPTFPMVGERCANSGAATEFFEDFDGDGDGKKDAGVFRCAKPMYTNLSTNQLDCDDLRSEVNSMSQERCNGLDDDCDGQPDDGLILRAFYRDTDGDGFGDSAESISLCAAPAGYVEKGGDCSPNDAAIYPNAPERCNNIDDDCDGQPDERETDFADSDSADSNLENRLPRFPCNTNLMGECRAGRILCRPISALQVAPQCVSFHKPLDLVEKCDGLDNNCVGGIDEQPACGGPSSIFGAGMTFGARTFQADSGTSLGQSCNKARGFEVSLPSSNRWPIALNAGKAQVYWAEAPDGGLWDLSPTGTKFRLKFRAPASQNGTWVDSNGAISFNHPIVVLCGPNDDELVRYRANKNGLLLANDVAYDKAVTLSNFDDGVFLITPGSGFDLSRTKRVEVIVYPRLLPLTIEFDALTGFYQ